MTTPGLGGWLPPTQPAMKLTPWPYDEGGARRFDGLDFSVKIKGPNGVWFDLEDGQNYAIHSDSFASFSQTYRKREVNNEWVEGSFPVSAVRDNTTEPLVVYTKGDTPAVEMLYRKKLISAVEQLSWMLMVRFDDIAEYWQCWASDYTIERQREFIHANLTVVRVNVSRLPEKILADASADEV